MAKRKHHDLDGSTSHRHHRSRDAKKRKLSDDSLLNKANASKRMRADSENVESSQPSITFGFDLGEPPGGMNTAARRKRRKRQRRKLVRQHADVSALPNVGAMRLPVDRPSAETVRRDNSGAMDPRSALLLRDISRTQLMRKPIKRWVHDRPPPAHDLAAADNHISRNTTPSVSSITPVQNVPIVHNSGLSSGHLDSKCLRKPRPTSSVHEMVPQVRRRSSPTNAVPLVAINKSQSEPSIQPLAYSKAEVVARAPHPSGIMHNLPGMMRRGNLNHLSALKMRIEPKVTSVPDRLRRPSDENRVPEMLSFLNDRGGYGSDDDEEDDSSDSSDREVEDDIRPPFPERLPVTTSQPADSQFDEEHDHDSAGAVVDSAQSAPVSALMFTGPIPLNSHSVSIAEGNSLTIEHDDPRSNEAEQQSQGKALHKDDEDHFHGPQGTTDDPSARQPVNSACIEDDAMMVDMPQSTVPLFAHVTAHSISPAELVEASPPPEVTAPQSDEELEQTITAVSSAVFDATRPLPVSELQHEMQLEGEPLPTESPEHSSLGGLSRKRRPAQQHKQAVLPARCVSPIVSILKTSPLGDVEDVVDIEDLATDAGGGEDLIQPDESAADEVDEGAGNEHKIELTGSSEEFAEGLDGTEDNGEASDMADASETDDALPADDPSDLNSTAEDGDMMSTDDVDDADVMQTTKEDTAIEALPDRSQEASQQLLNDAMNAMLAEQSSGEAQLNGSPSLPLHDSIPGDTVVPGSESSALAGSDTFAVIQQFDREVESPTLRKKRKMTGITSKHFTPVKSTRRKRAEKRIDTQIILDADADVDAGPATHSSPSLYDTPASATTYPTRSRRKAQSDVSKASTYATAPETPSQPGDKASSIPQTSSTTKKRRVPAGTSACPVPPITEKYFGLIQDKLWTEPFWLLVAVIFLNLTNGRTAAPVFWALKEDYPAPEALAAIDASELFNRIERLGLANNRTKTILGLAKTWVEFPPVKGVRYRKLHYPNRNDGKEYKPADVIETDSELIEGLVEIAHLPGCGHYALDSWRIFCRDVLRGVATDFNGADAETENFEPEWQRVLPLDKELRACLRWMWMREGFVWDIITGKKRPATEEEMEQARLGEMIIDDPTEQKFAVAAAAEAASGAQIDSDDAVVQAGGKKEKNKRRSRAKKARKSSQRQESAELQASAAESVVKR
ncbi:hypothetical protein B0A48_07361 [Cryoendolithus antarcticus]|uniref:HhH-GPD domain-containing protein n=1 Tax=Cryoendolithus antarcticus TaxID=1507870 RepID=A0A1V8T8Q7_9PEZI|nr:hypothetical protein B0A48_07361 [Cryoendolithus antarcticus]